MAPRSHPPDRSRRSSPPRSITERRTRPASSSHRWATADGFLPDHLGDCVDVLGPTGRGPRLRSGHRPGARHRIGADGAGAPDRSGGRRRRRTGRWTRPTSIVTSSVVLSGRTRPRVPTRAATTCRPGRRVARHASGRGSARDPGGPAGRRCGIRRRRSTSRSPRCRRSTPSPRTSREIVSSRWTSNSGPFCERLEAEAGGVPRTSSTWWPRPAATWRSAWRSRPFATLLPDRDEVIVPSYTFPSTANAVIRAGLRPRFCDVDPSSLCATVGVRAPLLSSRTAAIVPVHAHGNPCDMPELRVARGGVRRDAGLGRGGRLRRHPRRPQDRRVRRPRGVQPEQHQGHDRRGGRAARLP